MSDGLLVVERLVIESLSKKEKNIYELALDTNLDNSVLLNVLPNLLMRNSILYKKGIYSLNKEASLLWGNTINSKQAVKEEVKELFTTMVNEYFKEELASQKKPMQLKIQKIWLTEDEEKHLKAHLANLESFFQGVKSSRQTRPLREKTCEQKVLILGLSNYSDLVHSSLEAV